MSQGNPTPSRHGITREQHEAVLRVTPNKEYRIYFELPWHTGGSQTDIASLAVRKAPADRMNCLSSR
jgi:hypothetical protein